MVKAGSKAVQEADPSAKVVLGGIAWQVDFVGTLLRDHNVGPSVDIINAHSYYETWSPEPAERLPKFVNRLDDLIAWYGNGQAIWMAEMGYSNFRRGHEVSSVYRARMTYEHSPEYQAQQLVRMLALIALTGKVPLVAWYRINDLPSEEEVISDVNNRHLGVLAVGGRVKPAFEALRPGGRLFGGRVRCVDEDAMIRQRVGSDSEVHCFQHDDGSMFVVAWLRANVPGLRPEDGRDDRRETVDLQLPGDYASVETTDVFGRNIGGVRAGRVAGGTRLDDVELRGGRTLVIRLRPH